MALQSSGAISLVNLAIEFGGGQPHSLSEYYRGGSYVGTGAPNVPTSGTISLSQFYGSTKAFVFNQTIASHTANYRLHDALVAAGWDGIIPVIATVIINSGIYVYESGLGNWAMIIGKNNNTNFPVGSTINLINHGTIIGTGGNGGNGASGQLSAVYPTAGANAGHALLLYSVTNIWNYGNIYGGGGGGGGGGTYLYSGYHYSFWSDGAGGGGGAGFNGGVGGINGYGWLINGNYRGVYWGDGQDGSSSAGGPGGGWPSYPTFMHIATSPEYHTAGGNGGNPGVAGATGATSPKLRAGGDTGLSPWGIWRASAAGGAAGYYCYNNGYAVWQVAGTRAGQVI